MTTTTTWSGLDAQSLELYMPPPTCTATFDLLTQQPNHLSQDATLLTS